MRHFKFQEPPENIKLLLVGEAPPLCDKNYFYNPEKYYGAHGGHRGFFRGIMQGVGLVPFPSQGARYSEEVLLQRFIDSGYFLIDTSPEPLVNAAGSQLPSDEKLTIMLGFKDSLQEEIERLNPEKVIFVSRLNQRILDDFKPWLCDRLATNQALPLPLFGNQGRFVSEFPSEFSLNR